MRTQWIFLFFFWFPVWAGAQIQVPPLTDPVMDLAGMITPQDQRTLRSLIVSFHERGKGQIQVLTLQSLNGVPIEQASIQIVDKWQLGTKKRDDGVLILVAAQEHKIRIEVGQGLEGDLPDIKAKRIISDLMVPLFRRGSPSQGILMGTFQVMKTIDPSFESNEDVSVTSPQDQPQGIFDRYEGLFILIFIIFMILMNLFRPRRRTFWGGGGFGGGGWGGGGWGGGSGGGWSGGGGGFSGGGASGDW